MSRQTKEYAKKLVAQMTVEEKMSQMLYESPAIERLNIPAYNWWNEALHGVARAGVWKQNSPAGYAGSLRDLFPRRRSQKRWSA